MYEHLPISSILDSIKNIIATDDILILSAPPGSGKTTIIPIYLMPFFQKKILVLEPRRIAAKSSAERSSYLLKESVGNRVGYRIRFDTKVSSKTRVEYITEGIFLKKIQNDPELQDVGLVIFDEFHERSLNSDLSLALLMESKKLFKTDIKLIIMSATISPDEIQKKIPIAKVLKGEGSLYPVTVEYLGKQTSTIQKIKEILFKNELPHGNVLIFLPGAGEILSAINEIEEYLSESDIALPLYSELDGKSQNKVFEDISKRKIIFATNIAETSLTIDRISVVIDSGYQKRNYYSTDSGMNSLKTERISLDSAEQRKGRAGRVQSGICFRLWTKEEEREFSKFTIPQIKYTDLTEVLLHTKKFGVDVNSLFWIDQPNVSSLLKAQELLIELGALDADGNINDLGRKILEFPLSSRVAIMILKASILKAGLKALELSVILSEKLYTFEKESLDLSIIYENLKSSTYNKYKNIFNRNISNLTRLFPILENESDLSIGALLALAYPDRVAKRRNIDNNTYKFNNGKGGFLQLSNSSSKYEYIIVPELDSRSGNSKIFLFAEISKEEIYFLFSDIIKEKIKLSNHGGDRFKVLNFKMLGELILDESENLNPEPKVIESGVIDYLTDTKCEDLNWDSEIIYFINRVNILNSFNSSFQVFNIEDLKNNPKNWIEEFLVGIRRISELRKLDILNIIKSQYSYNQIQEIEKEVPEYFFAPSGRKIKIVYQNDEIIIQIKLQELFGLLKNPKYAYGNIQPTFHLLSPAARPIQVTKDLESFWSNTYKEVRKELRGRYPKHPWPEDPLNAIPTYKTKKNN